MRGKLVFWEKIVIFESHSKTSLTIGFQAMFSVKELHCHHSYILKVAPETADRIQMMMMITELRSLKGSFTRIDDMGKVHAEYPKTYPIATFTLISSIYAFDRRMVGCAYMHLLVIQPSALIRLKI